MHKRVPRPGNVLLLNADVPLCVLQLLGFSDLATGGMAVCASVGAAIGFLLGGGIGDYLAMRYPNIARPAVNQVSQVLAGPLYVALLKGLPGALSPSPLPSPCLGGVVHHLQHMA